MTRIILVRHGQTIWNVEPRRFRGRMDLPLDEIGLAQAERVAQWVARFPIKAVYSSPLHRAVQTAQPTANHFRLSVQIHQGFLDFDYGEWKGHTDQEVAEKWGDIFEAWLHSPHTAQMPNGENLGDVRVRSTAAIYELAEQHHGETIMAVAHQVVNKVTICALLGLDNSHYRQIHQDNGGINIFEYADGMFKLMLMNGTCHLEGMG